MKKILSILLIIPILAACQPAYTQNRYSYGEVGQNVEIEFARVVRVKPIDIQGKNTGLGMNAGMLAGSAAGYQFGNGNGQLAGMIAGLVIGGIAGHIAEQEAQNQRGFEYIVVTEHKKTKSIVQYQAEGDIVFKKGDRVMVQTSGTYQRVMPTDDLPASITKAKGIEVK